MAKSANSRKRKVRYRIKLLIEQFSDYENTVALICSLESWFEYCWGEKGHEVPRLLDVFDRFPDIDGMSPDFLVRFRRPYILLGECMKTFRGEGQGKKDVDQLVSYSQWKPTTAIGDKHIPHDVMVLVDIFSDDIAADQIAQAENSTDEGKRPEVPIVIVGYSLDKERISGEWYKFKWRRGPGNHEFSDPNIAESRSLGDLNAFFVKKKHSAVPLDQAALDLSKRNPLVNDTPPPIYTVVRIILPALIQLLDDTERDALQASGKIEKVVSREDILQTPVLSAFGPRPRVVQAALDFLVSPLGLAARIQDTDPQQYRITIDMNLLKRDLKDVLSEKAARTLVNKLGRKKRSSRRKGTHPKQMSFEEFKGQIP